MQIEVLGRLKDSETAIALNRSHAEKMARTQHGVGDGVAKSWCTMVREFGTGPTDSDGLSFQ